MHPVPFVGVDNLTKNIQFLTDKPYGQILMFDRVECIVTNEAIAVKCDVWIVQSLDCNHKPIPNGLEVHIIRILKTLTKDKGNRCRFN